MKNLIIYIGLLIAPFCLMVSCKDDPDYPDTTQYETVITGIKIVNGGLSGTETIVGKVDENKKQITFPEVNMNSDLSHVKFEIQTSDNRAYLDSAEYNFVVAKGASERVRTIKLVNNTRYREYFVTIRLDVPVWGADFTLSKIKVYDYSAGVPKLEDYATGSIDKPIYNNVDTYGRQYGISLDNVLIINRNATGPGLVKLSDIKQGNIGNFTPLTGSDVSTEVWYSSGGLITNGHVYVSNGTPWGNTLYIRVWDESHPEVIPSIISYDYPVIPRRYDGFLSGNIDANGSGYFFISGNTNVPVEEKIARFSVTGFSTLSKVDLLPSVTPLTGTWAAFNYVPGSDGEYLYSGYNGNHAPVRLMNSNAGVLSSIPETAPSEGASYIPQTSGDAKIVVFNQERYLMVMDLGGTFSVYDITQGATTEAALALLNTNRPLFTYSLGASIPGANASMTTAWVADGDNTLYLLAGGVQTGFAVFEIPKKVKETTE